MQQQANSRLEAMLETAQAFSRHPERYEWLRALLATYALDSHDGVLVELKSVPDQGCWAHSGLWLTADGRFIRFAADETYGARPLDGSGRIEFTRIEDVTTSTSVSQHVPGVGMSDGYLAFEALKLVREASEAI
ncbi:hypothetical protein ACFQ0E_08200 [Lysobacter brunescens]|uniref:Integron gene cassette protein n=1 Tax=Lysobacter brunescens TaxID=262323 RepID=A0ABW2YCF8_9GAMM